MATVIERVSNPPNEGPVSVVGDGTPVAGEWCRITTSGGAVVYERYTAPVAYVPVKRPQSREWVIDNLPGGTMKACRDSTDAAVIKQFYKFLAKGGFTYAEGAALAAFLKAKAIIDDTQETAFLAAWPSA